MITNPGITSVVCFVAAISTAVAGPLQEARVSRLYNDVLILPSGTSGRPAMIDDVVKEDTAIRTGLESRAELKYRDNTLVRLGAQTLFSFDPGSRNMDLGEGVILFQIPRGLGGAEIRTGAVTAAITGTTGFVSRSGSTFKVILLEGALRVKLNDRMRESMEVKAGQMLFGNVNASSMRDWKAIDVDVRRLMKTSKLLDSSDFERLSVEAEGKIFKTIAHQDVELAKGELVATNVVVEGNGSDMVLEEAQREVKDAAGNDSESNGLKIRSLVAEQVATKKATKSGANATAAAPAPTPLPDNRQFIATVTTSATPTVTTVGSLGNGATVAGAVYQGSLVDGPASTFLFGSGNAFDASRNFDADFGTGLGTTFPGTGVATFTLPEVRFDSVNPVFDTALGPKDVALISVGGVESGAVAIDLSNLNSLFLATMGDSLKLDKNTAISVAGGSGFQTLQLYDRSGKRTVIEADFSMPDADLIVDSANNIEVKGYSQIQVKRLEAKADGDISLDGTIEADLLKATSGDKLTVSGPIDATRNAGQSGGNVDLLATGEIRIERAIAVSDSALGQENSSGGNITIESTKTNQKAIRVTNSGQLHALLSASSVGPGGSIVLRSSGGDILVDGGSIVADRGLVDIRNSGAAGAIDLKDSTISADIVKVGALGNNGTLTVGGGSISADTALRLYAGGSNGSIVFDDNVSLNGNSAKIISANTVTIKNNKTVTVNGPSAASVYTNSANYTGSGGNGSTSGVFGGKGATTSAHSASPGIDN